MTSASAYYLGPHGTNGETIFVSLDLPVAVKFVSFQSEFTSSGTPLSINEVRFLQGRSASSASLPTSHYLAGGLKCGEEPDLGPDRGVTSHEYNWEDSPSDLYR